MEHPRPARTAAFAGAACAALLAASTACSGSGGDAGTAGSAEEAGAGSADAAELGKAQLVQFEDAKVVPEAGQQGVYGELSGVVQTRELREKTELDKPECADAADGWSALDAVREAPASVAVFARGDDTTVSHALLALPASAAEKALDAASIDPACSEYQATLEDGTTADYTTAPLDIAGVADGSRAFSVRTEQKGAPVWMYGIVYRHGDHLGATTVIGPNADSDYEELLTGFTGSAIDQEAKVLG